MLLSVLPDFDQRTPAAATRKPSRIVWQQRYDGIAHVAYQGGKAMACISGPWSDKFVLTWWEPMPGGQLELYDSIDEARQSVERRLDVVASGRPAEVHTVAMESRQQTRSESWITLLRRTFFPARQRLAAANAENLQTLRRRYFAEETDLSGLNFGASR